MRVSQGSIGPWSLLVNRHRVWETMGMAGSLADVQAGVVGRTAQDDHLMLAAGKKPQDDDRLMLQSGNIGTSVHFLVQILVTLDGCSSECCS